MWLVVGVVLSLHPASSQAQEQVHTTHCEAIRDEVPRLLETVSATGEGLEELAAQAKEALDCYNGRLEPRWAVWLLTNRVYALNRLQRYTEAQEVVEQFFSIYAQQADSADIAGFYMWDLRFKYRQGEFEGALESHRQGLPYAHKLTDEYQKRYLLNAGSVHMAEGKFKESLNIYRNARQTFSGLPSDGPTLEVYGRTLLGEAEAQLDRMFYQNQAGIDLDTLVIDLRHAASMFDLAGSLDRYASAQSTLALAHALNGNMDDALPVLDLAFNQIRQHSFRKQHL